MSGKPFDPRRLPRLNSGVLAIEAQHTQRQINELVSNINKFRSNPSDAGVVSQMQQRAQLEQLREHKAACDQEIANRKDNNLWDPKPVERTHVAKKNPPIPPKVQKLDPYNPWEDPPGGEETTIKIDDARGCRAWRPEDGPIHGATPADTITDVSKTTSSGDEN